MVAKNSIHSVSCCVLVNITKCLQVYRKSVLLLTASSNRDSTSGMHGSPHFRYTWMPMVFWWQLLNSLQRGARGNAPWRLGYFSTMYVEVARKHWYRWLRNLKIVVYSNHSQFCSQNIDKVLGFIKLMESVFIRFGLIVGTGTSVRRPPNSPLLFGTPTMGSFSGTFCIYKLCSPEDLFFLCVCLIP